MKPLAEISLLSIIFNACVQKNVKIFSVAFLMVVLRVLKVQTFHSTYKTITLSFNLPDIILKAWLWQFGICNPVFLNQMWQASGRADWVPEDKPIWRLVSHKRAHPNHALLYYFLYPKWEQRLQQYWERIEEACNYLHKLTIKLLIKSHKYASMLFS